MNLTELEISRAKVLEIIEASDGEVTPLLEEALKAYSSKIMNQIDAFAELRIGLRAEVEYRKERKRVQEAYRKSTASFLERLDASFIQHLRAVGKVEMSGHDSILYLSELTPEIALRPALDMSMVPKEWKKSKVIEEIDEDAVVVAMMDKTKRTLINNLFEIHGRTSIRRKDNKKEIRGKNEI